MTRKYRITNEVLSAVTHGIGIGLSIWGLILLIMKGIHDNSSLALFSLTIYGMSLVGLYLFSTLFHSFYFTRMRHVFQCLDHCGINLLIVGTYTPYCLLAIRGKTGIWMLGSIWALALIGIFYHLFAKHRKQIVETILYIVMGWLCILGFRPLALGVGINSALLLILGGIIFTLGAAIYSIKRLKFTHVIWHLLVMGGTFCMFLSIYMFI